MLDIKSRIGAVVLATTVVSGGALALASPVSAAYTCADNQVCLYKNSDFTGSVYVLPKVTLSSGATIFCARDLSASKYSDGSSVSDTVSSVVNNSNSVLFLYENKNSGGKHMGIAGGYRLWNLDNVQVFDSSGHETRESFNDRASTAC
ncbi:peptidase inhibitor family I36 protein [Streptomyces sp. NBC_00414]|uniref:peptidase inhibitor family I36 protein n=1 Tax=Streptomyces sp. NBC_00414 TaxID=2975739 RepID=UPI002E1A2BDE